MLSLVLGAAAVPAKRGLWKTLRLADGQEVRARLTGDDIVHYYQSESGDCYVIGSGGVYTKVEKIVLAAHAKARRAVFDNANRARARKLAGRKTPYGPTSGPSPTATTAASSISTTWT